jgi:predicted MFS family arabinose efflux permease
MAASAADAVASIVVDVTTAIVAVIIAAMAVVAIPARRAMDVMVENPHAAGGGRRFEPPPDRGLTPDRTPMSDRRNEAHAPGAAAARGRPGDRVEARNTLWLECYQIVVRVGWIFKTETIIMPAVLDAVVDSGLLRGLLPVLNRGGQSVPPLLFAGRLARRPRKQWSLMRTSLAMAACFAGLAVAWPVLAATRPDLLAFVFLAMYAAFSASNGLNQLTLAALQGKLIPAGHRGRAMVVSVAVGSVLAIAAAVLLLGPWLARGDFPSIFAATAAFFAVAAGVPLLLDEPADDVADPHAAACDPARGGTWLAAAARGGAAWRRTLRGDRPLVRLCAVAACFSAVLMLFPHYQAFARDRLGSGTGSLLTWVVVQNAATGLVSLVAGPLSDRCGTRIVLVWLVALSSLTPLVVTLLSLLPLATAVEWFWIVYAPLGLNPISLKIFTNYALELAPAPAEHPRYVSIVGAALALPFVVSPLVGAAVDWVGFRHVFVAGAAVIAAGAVFAVGLPEPRHRQGGRAGVSPEKRPAAGE